MDKELYAIVLKYEGKEYCYLQYFTGRDEEWDAERQVHWMYEEGNYACDCNRSLFLARYLGLNVNLECGNTIELVSIKKESEVLSKEQKKTIGALIVGMMESELEGYRKLSQVGVTFTDKQSLAIQKRLSEEQGNEQ